jgi:predicted transcriptional regulator
VVLNRRVRVTALQIEFMAIDYFQVGQRLRAHRMGIGLSPDQAAKQLGISRAALYNYEKGEGPVKL